MSNKTIDPEKCQAIGIDYNTVTLHQKRLINAIEHSEGDLTFKIIDTCRVDNQLVLPKDILTDTKPTEDLANIVSLVPAAGASSRFSKPLAKLIEALKCKDVAALKEEIIILKKGNAGKWALPKSIEQLIDHPEQEIAENDWSELLKQIEKPKALFPCVKEGESFLEMKCRENDKIPGLLSQVFVTPLEYKERFKTEMQKHRFQSKLASQFLEQDLNLSTIRFNQDGSPAEDEHGQYSPVPAGHGALVRLFPAIKQQFSDAETLLIRNIDNVTGIKKEVISATATFLEIHNEIFQAVKDIRRKLRDKLVKDASETAVQLINKLRTVSLTAEQERFLTEVSNGETRPLWQLQLGLFHTPIELIKSLDEDRLLVLFDRPVNSLGQVPNSGKDVGGTPVVSETKIGPMKICLEVPHASEEDRKKFLEDPRKATHFNPVFIAAEAIEDSSIYESDHSPFWLLSKKFWKSREVRYHETLLSEILGNSQFANCVFVEIPRILFNPHKTLDDTIGKSSSTWLDQSI